ncbi:helix-turn-helix domain-containing protein [Herminiimonas glaciei]|uniref:Helix-turn-helix domain-containing protein n=1 Tax=Herminiimonas glaciei TaxID=523788 RepID=A0ABW2IB24_9BURK
MHQHEYWTYWRDGSASRTEYGFWAGDSAPALGTHFHDEGQLTLVLAGSRKFEVDNKVIRLDAGQCLYIPAGMPHCSLPHLAVGTRCLNIYYQPGHARQQPAVLDIRQLNAQDFDVPFLLQQMEGELASIRAGIQSASATISLQEFRNSLASIATIAAASGLSREAFSRKFTRDIGMSPHAYRLVGRLNAARRQLRDGISVADTATDFGFADQSHFGRHFFRVFGVTPGAYRNSMRRSQTF